MSMGSIAFPNNKDYYASAGYASGNGFLGLTGGNNKVNPKTENVEGVKGGSEVGKTSSTQHLGAELGLVDRLGQYDGGSLNNPTHKSVVPGFKTDVGEILDLRG